MREGNVISEKTMQFAIRIVKLYECLVQRSDERVLARQLLKSGTSIGANVREACNGQSRKDFIAKLSISLKEAAETEYWLELLFKTGYISEAEYSSLNGDCKEILKLLVLIIKSAKRDM